MEKVGIDDITVYVPKHFLKLAYPENPDKLTEFAESREINPGKILKGIGTYEISVPDVHEDSVTMGAMAALKLMKRNDLGISDIGKLYVGTETGVDFSKPVASYILGMLETGSGEEKSMRRCSAIDQKFACAGASYSLEHVTDWIRVSPNEERRGIVIATDIAKYPMGKEHASEECTQGAGAVALLVKKNPRLIALDNVTSTVTKDEKDFFRPLNRETAVVDGQFSIKCYLDACKTALIDYEDELKSVGLIAPQSGETVTDYIDYMCFHIPFPRMAEYASAFLLRHEWRGLPKLEKIIEKIGPEPKRENFETEKEFKENDKIFRKKFSKTEEFQKVFKEKIENSLVEPRRIGNIYNGSIYLAFHSALEVEHKGGIDLNGKRFAFGSYGSGYTFKAFGGIIQPEYEEVVERLNLLTELDQRKPISLEDYEQLHEGRGKESLIPPKNEFALVRIGESGVEEGYRFYEFIK